jgi:hypothetical protein
MFFKCIRNDLLVFLFPSRVSNNEKNLSLSSLMYNSEKSFRYSASSNCILILLSIFYNHLLLSYTKLSSMQFYKFIYLKEEVHLRL